MTDSNVHVLGALALELAPGSSVARDTLAQAEAGALAALIAHDLAGFAAEASALELVMVGAHYDAVELLRPSWPLHHELDQLAARAPQKNLSPPLAGSEEVRLRTTGPRTDERTPALPAGREGWGGGRVIAFGAHDARLPGALTPSPDYAGGPLRLVPFLLGTPVLGGDAAVVARVGAVFEHDLMERGMAGAATALAAQDAFGLRIEHARYLTVHDLAALMAMQYEHAGLAPLWPILEAALLAPEHEEWLDALPEPLVHYADREARIALFTPQAWRARYAPQAGVECEKLERQFELFQARQRQFAAVLQAHGVAMNFVHCDTGETRDAL